MLPPDDPTDMPDIAVSPDQRERLRWIQRRLEEDIEYGHVRPCDALEYLFDHAETTGGLSGISPEEGDTARVKDGDRHASRNGAESETAAETEVDDQPTDATSAGFGTLHTSPSANVVRIGNATTDHSATDGETDSDTDAETDAGDDGDETNVDSETEADDDIDAETDDDIDTEASDDDDTDDASDNSGEEVEATDDANDDVTDVTDVTDETDETDDADCDGSPDEGDNTFDEGDDTIAGEEKTPDEAGTASASPTLNAMMNLLETHDDKWREAGSGEEKYEVDLPDGGTEGARTKDDVKAVLFKEYR